MKKPLPVATAGRRQLGHNRTQSRPSFEETLFDEVLNYLLSRVGMNLEIRCEGSHGGKRLARLELTADECFRGGENNLIEDRSTWS